MASVPTPVKSERFVITPDQLVSTVYPKLQQAAETAVNNAIATNLNEAVRSALSKIDESNRGSRQSEDIFNTRLEVLIRSAQEEILGRVESRLAEMESYWEQRQMAYDDRAQQLVQQSETRVLEAHRDRLAEAQKVAQTPALGVEPQLHTKFDHSIIRAAEEFEATAARVADRQLIRMIEDKETVSREAAAQLDSQVAQARAALESASRCALDELRRQMEVQINLAVSEAGERVTSSFASLEAENRSACDARRRSLESDVASAAEQAKEQFRTGIKAFLYSCLVAAVSAVGEHTQTTLDGFGKDLEKSSGEIARHPNSETP
ncbi:MAG: hypothetical protein NVS9B4_12540 [Candidatus Acidiferrum sp.]